MKFLAILFMLGSAHAQVTDAPIVRIPPLEKMVVHTDLMAGRYCAAWWERSADKYGDYYLARAAIDVHKLHSTGKVQDAISSRDLSALLKARTHNVSELKDAMDPCMNDEALFTLLPPPAWIVAPIASGRRPAYILQADGKRGAQSGYADTTLAGQPMWCDCKVRSVETTSSTYCRWATSQKLVTLCRAQ